MSVFASAACLLIITLGALQASRSPAAGLQLASYHSLLVTATLALVMAASLYAPSTIAFVRLPLGTTFYLILVLLTSLRETMRLRAAASSLSSSIAAFTGAALNSPQAKQPASQETAHALMACAVLALCALALAGSL